MVHSSTATLSSRRTTSQKRTYGYSSSLATIGGQTPNWSFRFTDTNKERVQKSSRLNGELDTVPSSYNNQITFGRVIREVAKDRTKDVIDIRDMKIKRYRRDIKKSLSMISSENEMTENAKK